MNAPRALANAAAAPLRDGAFPAIPGVSHHMVEVNGIRMHYAEAGTGEPLVLLHGFPQNWYMWRDVIPELSRHYRVIAPDLRGSGWTDAPATGYGKEQLADEVASFMDAVGAPRARVMGHDMGGYIGFLLGMRHPEKVERYLALNIATPWPTRRALPDAWRLAYQPVLAAPVLGAALLRSKTFIRSMLTIPSTHDRWSPQDIEMFAAPRRDPARAAAGSAMYRTFLMSELLPWARGAHTSTRLEPKTLLLVGEHDPVIRPNVVAGYEAHARDMQAEFIPDAGHFLAEERPDTVVERALAFFDGP
ncbi:MAG: putative hydrolase or acyltransferase of alpha/beta superfamily [Thermoleophilia bacterium]|nr:putative hydrolase or acyltransferase of alpha/beta superfamily [Thermoleophilia bacterium]